MGPAKANEWEKRMEFIDWFVENANTIMHCIVAIAITLQVFINQMIFHRLDSHSGQLFAIRQCNASLRNGKERKSSRKEGLSKSSSESPAPERQA